MKKMPSNCRMRMEALDAYLHGMLNETQQREITAHLLVCPECNKNLANLESETYTIGKGLRNIPTPPMSVAAAELVTRYSESKAGAAPAPFSALESSQTMQPAASAPPAAKERASRRMFKAVRSGVVCAWDIARRRSLLKVAGITFAAGMGLWFAAVTAKRIESIDQAQNAQTTRFTSLERSQAELRKTVELTARDNQKLIADLDSAVQKSLVKEATFAELQVLQEQEKLSTAIAELKAKIDQVGSRINARDEDSAHLKKDLEKSLTDLLSKQAEMNAMAARLKKLADKPDDAAPALAAAAGADRDEPGTLRLLADGENVLGWDDAREGAIPMTDRGQPVGWMVSLSNLAGTAVPDDGTADARAATADLPHFTGTAVFNGRVFVGNGSAENNLVAFDGASGRQLWSVRTRESGGGTPVIADDGRTVYFTENTSVRAINISNGVQDWVRNLGGQVLTQVAIDAHHVYVVHATSKNTPGIGDSKFPFSITCLQADGGNKVWSKGLSADAISSPVVEGGKVYIATRDGVLSVFDLHGNNLKSYVANATSAPVVFSGSMYFSAWAPNGRAGFEESLCQFALDNPARGVEHVTNSYPASYFLSLPAAPDISAESGGAGLENLKALMRTEQSVPALGDTWSYYGARPTIVESIAFGVLGDHLVAWDLRQAKCLWSMKVAGKSESPLSAHVGQPALTPPAFANGRLYLGSIWGDLICIDAQSGALRWRYRLPGSQSITSQLVLDQGRAYTTTSKGLLVCVDTGDANATGWTMWGGSPGHNGPSSVKWLRRE